MIRMKFHLLNSLFILLTSLCLSQLTYSAERPNIVMVITDDQGYGDLGFTGNPVLKTPHIDHLIQESIWLEDYHVAPTCSPTRSALLTGRWTNRTGVWHTINGRSMLRENEITLADFLKGAGYETAIFGKWHLGDNYPYRPEDRGFTHTYYHGAGGIGQTPDVWNNDYFDDQFYSNGEVVQSKGYCTDVFFQEAGSFIKGCVEEGKPFFTYLSTNTPHAPLNVPEQYSAPYEGKEGVDSKLASFFGMIANIDENVGRLRELLEDLKAVDNTIFIFTTDNGSGRGNQFFNAGMTGKKGSEYEGGHRVPFALHWPAYGLTSHEPIEELTHMVDIVPTLLDLCGVKDEREDFDGVSLRGLLKKDAESEKVDWKKRVVISDSQRAKNPSKWKKSSVMSGKWRLINGKELYDIKKDPSQSANIIENFPVVADRLKTFYEEWWTELEPTFSQDTEIYLGDHKHPVVHLNSHDWIQRAYPAWNQSQVRNAFRADIGEKFVGYWAVNVVNSGHYEISISRWPIETGLKISSAIPAMPKVPGYDKNYSATVGKAIPITKAFLKVDGKVLSEKPVAKEDTHITFSTHLEAGSHKLSPYFLFGNDEEGTGEVGAYFCKVSLKGASDEDKN